jgi:hypothetical protein
VQKDNVVERVCRLPVDFYGGGSRSMVQLVRDSGVKKHPEKLTLDAVRGWIAAHPELIESWLLWSANKRVPSGWYFSRHGARFDVDYFPAGETLTFADAPTACAEFILREVQSLMAI